MKRLSTVLIFFFLCWYGITGLCYAQDTITPTASAETQSVTPPATQPFSLPFKADINTLWDFQHKTFTIGGSVDFVSIYDVLFIGIEGVGAVDGNFFSDGLLGGQANVDVNKGITFIADKLKLGDNVKWLQGKYFPRIGYSLTYNIMKNKYYKDWNHFLTLRMLSF